MKKRPNLIYVFADQLRHDVLGYAGDEKAYTPNIDKFAGESMNFCSAVSVYPVCAPHRASLFTGKYPSSTGMVINEIRCMPDKDAIGHVLTDNGYNTGYIGKWHLYNTSGEHSDMTNQYVPPGEYRLGFDGYWAAYGFNHRYYKGFYFEDEYKRIDIDGYEPDAQTDMAIDFIDKADVNKPFSLFLSYGTPHDPWTEENVPKEFFDMFKDVRFNDPPNYSGEASASSYWVDEFDEEWFRNKWAPKRNKIKQVYYAMVANLDRNFGRLLECIDKKGIFENTIVVFTSDHGEMWGAHQRIAKKIFYDEAARIPFLIRWPKCIKEGSENDACLNTPDIMPSLLELMGLEIPGSVEGTSFAKSMKGQKQIEPKAAFMQGMGHTYKWKDGDEWRSLRDKQYTYALTINGNEYLFDNLNDPYQMNNLVKKEEYRQKTQYYREMLKDKMKNLNDEMKPCTWYKDKWTNNRTVIKSAVK